MARQNLLAGLHMTMPNVVRKYLRWFELAQRKKALKGIIEPASFPCRLPRSSALFSRLFKEVPDSPAVEEQPAEVTDSQVCGK